MYQVLLSAPGDTEVNAILLLFRSAVKGGNGTRRHNGSDVISEQLLRHYRRVTGTSAQKWQGQAS